MQSEVQSIITCRREESETEIRGVARSILMPRPEYSVAPLATIDISALKSSRFLVPSSRLLPYRDAVGAVNVHLLRKCKKTLAEGSTLLDTETVAFLDKLLRHGERHFAQIKSSTPMHQPAPIIPTQSTPKTVATSHSSKRVREVIEEEPFALPCSHCGTQIKFSFEEDGLCDRNANIVARQCCNYDCQHGEDPEARDGRGKFVICESCHPDGSVSLECSKCEHVMCTDCADTACIEFCVECETHFCVECMPHWEAAEMAGDYICKPCARLHKRSHADDWGSAEPWRGWPSVEDRDYGRVYVLPTSLEEGWFGFYDDGCGLQGALVLTQQGGQAVQFHRMRAVP